MLLQPVLLCLQRHQLHLGHNLTESWSAPFALTKNSIITRHPPPQKRNTQKHRRTHTHTHTLGCTWKHMFTRRDNWHCNLTNPDPCCSTEAGAPARIHMHANNPGGSVAEGRIIDYSLFDVIPSHVFLSKQGQRRLLSSTIIKANNMLHLALNFHVGPDLELALI